MKILILSDMHREFNWKNHPLPVLPDSDEYDAIVFAGDIGVGTAGIDWAVSFGDPSKPKVYINGNHEFYQQDYNLLRVRQKNMVLPSNFHLLDPGVVEIGEYVFIGATLWSNLVLGQLRPDPRQVGYSISDFRLITNNEQGRYFSTDDMCKAHNKEVNFIYNALATHAGKKCVVVTHFLPSADCVSPRYKGDSLNAYFASDCDWLMDDPAFNIPLWIAGHTHDRMVINHRSGTEIVIHPLGYPAENPTPYKWKIVEVK